MALNEEDFKCICGAEFDDIEQLQAHWNTATMAEPGRRPHYRLARLVGEPEPEEP
jgi:hypothetical protein